MNYLALDLDKLSEKQLSIMSEYGIMKILTNIYDAVEDIETEIYIENNQAEIEEFSEEYTEDEIKEAINKMARSEIEYIQENMSYNSIADYLFSYDRQKWHVDENKQEGK